MALRDRRQDRREERLEDRRDSRPGGDALQDRPVRVRESMDMMAR